MAPLKGELAAKLTEGSGLAFGQALRRKAQIPGFPNIRAWIPPMAEAFLPKSRTPQTRLSPGQLPFQESLSVLYEFAQVFSFRQPVPPLISQGCALPASLFMV